MNAQPAAPSLSSGGLPAPPSRCARFPRPLAALALLALGAAASPAAAQRLSFARFAAEQGLTGSQVWDVIEDRRGLVWVATTWGFSRFDGESFSTISMSEGLASPSARTVVEDAEGNLWFGNNSGVARFDGRTIVSFARQAGAPRSTVWDATVDAEGRLWFGTETGLVRFDRGEFRTFGAADGLASDYVYAVLAASDGALWVGSRGAGLARCRPAAGEALGECRIFGRADGLRSEVVRALTEDREGRIVAGTRGGGVAIFENDRFRSLGAADGLPSDDVYALLVRADGTLVVGTAEDGLAVCLRPERGACRAIRAVNGLPDNGVRALAEDRRGELWVGTEGGLALLLRDDLWGFSSEEGLPNPNVYAIAAGESGDDLWLGTFAGLSHLQLGVHGESAITSFDRRDGLPGAWVWAIVRGPGGVWVGTEGGLCRTADGRRCAPVSGIGELASTFVVSLGLDREGALWVGTADAVARIRLARTGRVLGVDRFAGRDDFVPRRAYSIAADGAGRVWLAHGDGLTVFEAGRFRSVGAAEGLEWAAIRGLGVDREGRLLVGGWGAVARAESDADGALRFRTWAQVAGLRDRMVLTLDEEEDGHLLLGTSRGVAVLDPEGGEGSGVVVSRIDASSGAVGSEVSHTMAYARDARGRRWFGFKGGITGVVGRPAPAPPPPRVAFSRLASEQGRIFVAPFSPRQHGPAGWLGGPVAELPYGDDSLRVWVRAVEFARRADLRFQYRLEGDEPGWTEARAELFRDLQNLKPGDYRILARAAVGDGPWSEPAGLAFRVAPAWWQQSSVPIAGVLALVAIGFVAVRARAHRLARLERELDLRIAERTDDLARYSAALAEHLQTVDKASERARRGERARRDLFARASHELRTPLTAVLGFSELLERSLRERLDAKQSRYLANVRESAEILLRQINELLEHLKLESGRVEVHLEEVALDSLVEGVVSLMEGFAAHRGVELATRLPAEMPVVRVDVAKLRQALMNLVSNAVKFSPPNGTVELEVELEEGDATPWHQPGYRVTVRDEGPGIAAEEMETIFEPYLRLEKTGAAAPGTGLGLPIARQFVELMGGALEVVSEPGRGAAFTVRLPVDPDPVVPLFDTTDSSGFEAQRSQVFVLDPDRDRFAELVGGLAEEEILAVRLEDLEGLRKLLASLRPRAVVLPFDPAQEGAWSELGPALGLVREAGRPLLLVPTVGGRAMALAFQAVVAAGSEESELRRVLRAAGLTARHTARRPLVLIAGGRENGVVLGRALAAAGCEHFRSEEAGPVRAAIADARPDAVAADPRHVCELAPLSGVPPAESGRPVWFLLDAGPPPDALLVRLAERIVSEGGELEEVLQPGLLALLDGPGRSAASRD